MSDTKQMLQRARDQFEPPQDVMGSLIRRRERKRRNQRIGAGALAITLALVSFVALTRAFSGAERPADEPTPKPPGIFSEVGGWIVYGWRSNHPSTPTGERQEPRGDQQGIWAVDPSHPGNLGSRIQLSTDRGTPLAWSGDGSKLLILSYEPPKSSVPARLFVLNADGTETTLDMGRHWECDSVFCTGGGSFSPDGAQVVYADPPGWRSSIYVVDTQAGTPRLLLSRGSSWLSNPTYSPDGTHIAYFDHLDSRSQLRVMNTDGTDVRLLLDRTGYRNYNLDWSPDGERLAFDGEYRGSAGIFVVGADGSGPTLVIPGGADPYWSPDGTRIAYRIPPPSAVFDCRSCGLGTLEIAALDGTHVQRFGSAEPGPWNPLVQPESEVVKVATASEAPTLGSILLTSAAVLTLVVGFVFIRRRRRATPAA
jgi:Tol biopolymer transport system component